MAFGMKRLRNGRNRGPKLPVELLDRMDELDDPNGSSNRNRRSNTFTGRRPHERNHPRTERGEGRTPSRNQDKPDRFTQSRSNHKNRNDNDDDDESDIDDADSDQPTTTEDVFAALKRAKEAKSKTSNKTQESIKHESQAKEQLRPKKESKSDSASRKDKKQKRLDPDAEAELSVFDAEIEALEARLGKDKKLQKELEDDGIDDLLDGVGSGNRNEKKWKDDAQKKLKQQAKPLRLKPGTDVLESDGSNMDDDSDDPFGIGALGDDLSGHSDDSNEGSDLEDGSEDDEEGDFEGDFDDADSSIGFEEDDGEDGDGDGDDDDDDDEGDDSEGDETAVKRVKENPYRPPIAASELEEISTRPQFTDVDDESQRRLERQVQGQVNRISEPSLVGIARALSDLYKTNSRHATSSAIIKVLLAAVDSQATLMDSFLILHASFGVAMIRVAGVELGAMLVDRIVATITDGLKTGGTDKRALNLVSFLSYFFVFGVVGPTVIYDYVRIFLNELTETNTEFLLRIIRCCGPQLRQDDPTSLKDIVILLQSQIAQKGVQELSVRTKFMIEAIDDLKNNKLKQARTATVAAEQVNRVKKLLVALPKQPEALQIGLEDLQNAGKKGKWWLVGASWRGNMAGTEPAEKPTSNTLIRSKKHADEPDSDSEPEKDVDEVGRSLGMNTDIRRAIFSTIVTSPSPSDGYIRLLKLRLTKQQQLQIPRVVVQAALAEQFHNPFYAHLSRTLCAGEHRFKKAFQFVIWDYWKRLGVLGVAGGGSSNPGDEQDSTTDPLSLNEIVNLGKLYAHLVATETQPMGAVLKPVLESTVMGGNTPILLHPPKLARLFLQLFFFAFFIDSSSSHRWTPPKRTKSHGDDFEDWERPFAGMNDYESKFGEETKETPSEVITKLVSNVFKSHPESAEALRFFAKKHIKIKEDGTSGVSGLVSKRSDTKKANVGWLAMDEVLRRKV